MLTIIVPMAGNSVFFPDSQYRFPKIFQEILGRPMIQVVIENLMQIKGDKRFVFIINDIDAKKFRLDNVLKMLTDNNCDIVYQSAPTKGAVCSLLLGVKYLNADGPVIISNADQIIDHDYNKIISFFNQPDIDGGVVCFDSVHPQWSYARVAGDNLLLETAEKEPISRYAIAGLYYFSKGRDFVESAMQSIMKDRSHEGVYYTSLVLNEMILKRKKLMTYCIEKNEYRSFYSPEKIQEYEQRSKGTLK
ncbi:MAG: glycosyltransferase family 2 protein [Pseudomonadota bacterium]